MFENNQNMLIISGSRYKHRRNLGPVDLTTLPWSAEVGGSYKEQSRKQVDWILQKFRPNPGPFPGAPLAPGALCPLMSNACPPRPGYHALRAPAEEGKAFFH